MAKLYDIAVLGATPAGYVAAWHAAAKGRTVALVNAPSQPTECPLAEWAPRGLFGSAKLPKSLARNCRAAPFTRVCYYSADSKKQAVYRFRSAAGHIFRTAELNKALRAAARNAGVKITTTRSRPPIRLEEECVRLLGGRHIQAKLLIVTQGRPAEVINELALPVRTVAESPLVIAGLDVPVRSAAAVKHLAGGLHVVESGERTELGIFFVAGALLHLRVISTSPAAGTRAGELSAMLAELQSAQIIPAGLSLGRARGAVWTPPAGVALELETHVAKRCLLAGTAGGFADSITGQTLAPTVRSAVLAADVAISALTSKNVQETLMRFKTSWRKSLADCLRPLSTNLQMLLPLLFANKRVVPRLTRALLYGQNI